MKINHKDNFFSVFAYDLKCKENWKRNCIRGVAYVPVLGPAAMAAFAGLYAFTSKSKNDYALAGAFAGRAIIALPGPLVLPIVDLIATIWKLFDKQKKVG